MLTTLYLISVASTGPGGPRVWRAASRFQPPVLRCCIPPSPANAGARAELGPGAVSGSEANRPPKKGRIAPPQPEGAFLPFGRLPGSDFLYLLVTTPQFELVVAAIVLISTLAYALETLPTGTLTAPMERLVSKADEATTGLFVVEYFLRWWSRSLRPSYVVKPLMVIDLFSIVPALLGGVAASTVVSGARGSFAFLRVLRVLKLQRYVRDDVSFAKLQLALNFQPSRTRKTDLPLARVVLTLVTLLLVSAGFLYEFEPQIPNYFTSLYYAITTLTTIGTIEPKTAQGALVVTVTILAGLAIVPFQLSRLAEAFSDLPPLPPPPLPQASLPLRPDSASREINSPVYNDKVGGSICRDERVQDIDREAGDALGPGEYTGSSPGVEISAGRSPDDCEPPNRLKTRRPLSTDVSKVQDGASQGRSAAAVGMTDVACAVCSVRRHLPEAKFCYACGAELKAANAEPEVEPESAWD